MRCAGVGVLGVGVVDTEARSGDWDPDAYRHAQHLYMILVHTSIRRRTSVGGVVGGADALDHRAHLLGTQIEAQLHI